MRRVALLAVAIAAVFIAPQAGAEIYQWTDANGKKVMSDKPPPGQVKPLKKYDTGTAPTGDSKPAGGTSAQTAPKENSWANKELEFRKRQMDQREKQEKAKKEEEIAASKKGNCDNARKQLQVLESGYRISQLDDNGKKSYMSDAQRAQEIEKARSYVDAQCK